MKYRLGRLALARLRLETRGLIISLFDQFYFRVWLRMGLGRHRRRSDRGVPLPPPPRRFRSSRLPFSCEAPFAVPSHGCTSSRFGPASRCCVLPRASLASGVRSRFPALVCGRRPLACLAQFPPVVFRSVIQTLCCQSAFVASSLLLRPVLSLLPAYVPHSVAASLAPISRCFCRCLLVGLLLPHVVSPFHVNPAVCSCSQVRRSSAPR